MASTAMAGYGPPLSRTSGYDVIYLIHEDVHRVREPICTIFHIIVSHTCDTYTFNVPYV